MDDDGQLRRMGHFHLLHKDALLHVARRVIVKIVEPDLAPGNHLRIFRQPLQLVEVFLFRQLRFVRMNADGRVNPLMLLREFDGAVERAGARAIAIADGEQGGDAGLFRAREDLGAIGVEALVLEMAVGVGVHKFQEEWSVDSG